MKPAIEPEAIEQAAIDFPRLCFADRTTDQSSLPICHASRAMPGACDRPGVRDTSFGSRCRHPQSDWPPASRTPVAFQRLELKCDMSAPRAFPGAHWESLGNLTVRYPSACDTPGSHM
jgi:hypothetical protein